ncbi:phosphotransferase [Streptomyces tuirus]|uniref:Phosphotransferase n=1 Tax=Streptomyces tuirus TaxID=68278 RepID=A0A941FEL2_9ACTN|nr:phosphotransferase [Streptomyces tuirus]
MPSGRPVVVKVVRPGRDWLAVASHDPGREGRLHTQGVYEALPPGFRAPVLSAREHDGVWTIVMEDISAELHAAPRHPARETLTAVAGMHTRFRGRPPREELCSTADRLRVFSPLQRLLHWHGSDNFPAMTGRMWELFAERADPRLAHAVLQLVADPSALLASLERAAPDTLLHGDLRPPNLGRRGDTVLAIDWGLSAHGPADLDFVYYLYNTAWGDDAVRDAFEAEWLSMTGAPPRSPAYELSVIYHTVAGELGVLLATAAHRPRGLPRPSEETVSWWMRRVRTAFDRTGHLL